MNLKIISLDSFSKNVKKLYKKYINLLNDLKSLKNTLRNNPKVGVKLGNNCYKMRLANSSKQSGKSGGFRVIYYYLDEQNRIYLITIYSKTELENVSDNRLLEILRKNGLL